MLPYVVITTYQPVTVGAQAVDPPAEQDGASPRSGQFEETAESPPVQLASLPLFLQLNIQQASRSPMLIYRPFLASPVP